MIITKYSASGNDFIIFHTFLKQNRSKLAKELCDRHKGIGADGLVVIVPHHKLDFEWEFYNSDGSIASMCGNASRAAAHYAYDNKLVKTKKMKFLTLAGEIGAKVNKNIVTSELTKPKYLKSFFHEFGFRWILIDTGVPHLVTIVDDVDKFDKNIAKKLRYKYNANVNFAQIKDQKLYVRTYERGVEDETLACGTGMAASFLTIKQQGFSDNLIKLVPKSKEDLQIKLQNNKLFFKGKVTKVFTTNV